MHVRVCYTVVACYLMTVIRRSVGLRHDVCRILRVLKVFVGVESSIALGRGMG